MKNTSWTQKVKQIAGLLDKVEMTDNHGAVIPQNNCFKQLCDMTITARSSLKTIYAIGNGASASMASHFAADLAKNGKVHTQVFSDLSLITAISNDLGYDEVFAEPLRRRGQPGDILVAISSSGNSKNILEAVSVAKTLEMKIITLSAMSGNNLLRKSGDLNVYIPAGTYGDAETCHAAILHYWIDLVVETADKPSLKKI